MNAGDARSVVAPASSANLGAGFDVLGMALTLRAEVGVGEAPDGSLAVDEHHPARVPFARLGGTGPLWFRTDIPMARGLGFSGAVRSAAAAIGAVVASGPSALVDRIDEILAVTTELEGHGDNVAASIHGGVTAHVGGRVVPVPIGPVLGGATILVWVPDVTTSTDASRRALSTRIDRSDAVVNLGSIAQFVLAFAHDDPDLLVGATVDRLHQSARLPGVPGAAEAIEDGVAAGAWCGWLSGSGPTVALCCSSEATDDVARALPDRGHVKRLSIDPIGLRPGPG